MSEEYRNISAAAQELGIKSTSFAKKVLGEADAIEACRTGYRNLYTEEHIQRTKIEMEEKRSKRLKEHGMRCCYHCRIKFKPDELKSSLCEKCRAHKTVLNFSCCGDCTKCPPSIQRLQMLRCAIDEFELKLKNDPLWE